MSWLGLPTFTGYDNLTLIYPNPLPLNMGYNTGCPVEDDEFYYPPEVEREMEKQRIETEQYWSNFPQWAAELYGDFIVL